MPKPHPPTEAIRIPDLSGRMRDFSPQEIRFRPGAYGLLLKDNQVLLSLSRFTQKWDLPGGGIEPWESLEDGLMREFSEETGLSVQIRQLLGIKESFIAFLRYPFHSLRFYYLVCLNPQTPSALAPQTQELLDLRWWKVKELPLEHMIPDDISMIQQALELH